MAIDTEQLATDVGFLENQPQWQNADANGRRQWLRGLGISTRAEAPDVAYHSALMDEMWKRVEPPAPTLTPGAGVIANALTGGIAPLAQQVVGEKNFNTAANFAERGLKEAALSMPAAGAAPVFAVSDALGITQSGSGTRLKRGVADLTDAVVQTAKQAMPGTSNQGKLTETLDALKQEIDAGAHPRGFEDWLAGKEPDKQDTEAQDWVKATTEQMARVAVKADHMGEPTPERVKAWLESDRNPARAVDDLSEPGPRQWLADYVATKDPASWQRFVDRVTESDTQRKTRLEKFKAEAPEFRPTVQAAKDNGKGFAAEMFNRTADMQGSPIDLATAYLPLLRGAKALEAAHAGGAIVPRLIKGMTSEAVQEGVTEKLQDPRAGWARVGEAAGLGAVGTGLIEGPMAGVGAITQSRATSAAEMLARPEIQVAPSIPTGPSTMTVEGQQVSYDAQTLSPDQVTELVQSGQAAPFVEAGLIRVEQALPATESTPTVANAQPLQAPDIRTDGSPVATVSEPAAAVGEQAVPSEEGMPTTAAPTQQQEILSNETPQEKGQGQEVLNPGPETVPVRDPGFDAGITEPNAMAEKGLTIVRNPKAQTGGFLNADIVNEGVTLIAQGVKDFAAWSAAMVKRFGEAIREYLAGVWQHAVRTSEVGAVNLHAANAQARMNPAAGTTTRAPGPEDAVRVSQFGERVNQDARLTPEVRNQQPAEFAVQRQQEAADAARAVIQERGLEEAQRVFAEDTTIPVPVRVLGLQQVMMRYDAQAALARATGNEAAVEAHDLAVDAAAKALGRLQSLANEAGRNLAIFNAYMRMSPDGQIRRMQRAMTRKVRESVTAGTGATVEEMEQITQEEIAKERKRAKRRVTVRKLKEPKAKADLVARMIKRLADALVERPSQDKPVSPLKQLIDAHLKATVPNFIEQAVALGADRAASDLLDQLIEQKRARGEALKAQQLMEQLQIRATQRAEQEIRKLEVELGRREAETRNEKPNPLRDLIDSHQEKPVENFIGKAIELGVTEQAARMLDAISNDAREHRANLDQQRLLNSMLKRLEGRPGAKQRRRLLPRVLDTLVKAESQGIAGEMSFVDAWRKTFNLPELTPQQIAELRDLARHANALPEGILRTRKGVELANKLALIEGIDGNDAILAAWYANILSGLSTQGVNIWGNAFHLTLRMLPVLASSPREFGEFLRGLRDGYKPGIEAMKEAWKTGRVDKALKYDDVQKSQALELLVQQGGPRTAKQALAYLMSLGGITRYVFRAMGAMDALFWHSEMEGMAHLAAARTLRQGGLKPGTVAFRQELIKQLGGDGTQWQADLDQARNEIASSGETPTTGLVNRRAWEIRLNRRQSATNEQAVRWADRMTFQQDPEGIGKTVSEILSILQQKLQIGGVRVLIPLVPFNRIVSNLFESGLDWTPVGILRGLYGSHLTRKGPAFTELEARERFLAGVLGTTVTLGAAALALGYKDQPDEDAPFMLYGGGPPTKAQRDAMPKGWRPFTLKIGDQYVSYAETPLAMMLAAAGSWVDSERYGKQDGTNLERVTLAMGAALRGFSSQGVLSSLADTFGLITGEVNPKQLQATPWKWTPGMVPGQGLLRDVSQLFDPRKITDDSVWSAMVKDIPVLKSLGTRPALNVLGEPVEIQGLPIVRRFVTNRKPDPTTDWIGRNRLRITPARDVIEIGDYLLPQSQGGVKLDESTKRRALGLTALENGVMTPDQRFEFVQRSGQLIKQRIDVLRQSRDNAVVMTDLERAALQRQVDAIAEAARKVAMKELVDKLR